jgi:hypothetical protein
VLAPDPTGILIFGSDVVARSLGAALAEQKFPVLLADDDWDGISTARTQGLDTFYGSPTSQYAALHLDLTGFGRLLAVSTRRELNSLACMHYRQEFGRERVYRLRVLAPEDSDNRSAFAGSLRAKALFDKEMTHTRFADLLAAGWRVKANALTPSFDWTAFQAQHGAGTLLLFGVDPAGRLRVANTRRKVEPRNSWTVIALVPPPAPAVASVAAPAAA